MYIFYSMCGFQRSGDAASYALDAHLVNHVETLSQFRKRLADKGWAPFCRPEELREGCETDLRELRL